MTLLEFARGPAMQVSVIILVVGIAWRLLGALLLRRKKDLSKARNKITFDGALRTVFNRMWIRKPFVQRVSVTLLLAYVFHIGLFIVIFFFAPHVALIRDITGLSWPSLPNGLVMLTGAVTLAALVALLIRRLTNTVLQAISNADDYISWFVTAAPILTGMLASAHVGARYETLLAIHILSVELLFIWFPFGKLMHTLLFLPSRMQLGATFERRGVSI